MSETKHVVDHLRFNYEGPFDAHEFYRLLTSFWREKGFDFEPTKEFEHQTKDGKQIEWVLTPWKQISHDQRNIVRMHILIYNYKKVDTVINKKKVKTGRGKINIRLDGFIAFDQWDVWEKLPMFQFIRTIYLNFLYKSYTERFEQRLNYDMHHLYNMIEKFFNVYRHYRVSSRTPPFATHT